MAPVFGVWPPIKPKLLHRVYNRLSNTGGCETVRYEPSKKDPNEVLAEINPSAFLGREYLADEARLRVEFDLSGDRAHYWIQWWEPRQNRGIGWHADETESHFGPTHVQIEYPDGTTHRDSALHVADEHPYRSFERTVTELPKKIEELGWK